MTDTKYLDEAAKAAGFDDCKSMPSWYGTLHTTNVSIAAHAATLEAFDRHRQEVSDMLQAYSDMNGLSCDAFRSFIIAKPDPEAERLQAICDECGLVNTPKQFAALLAWHKGELAKHGGKIVFGEGENTDDQT